MVFGTDIFALCDKLGLVVTCDNKSSVKELLEKKRVGVAETLVECAQMPSWDRPSYVD